MGSTSSAHEKVRRGIERTWLTAPLRQAIILSSISVIALVSSFDFAIAQEASAVGQSAFARTNSDPQAAQSVSSAPASTEGLASKGQDTSAELEEIIVTATRRQEAAQNVSAMITALSSQAIADAHIEQVDDLAWAVPSLNIVTRADHTVDATLRGVGSFGTTLGVGIYSDDVQIYDGQTAFLQPGDIERIEVLEGPQGVLYGGANIGGAVKFITKLPTDTFHAEASATAGVGPYGERTENYYVAVSGPFFSDNLKARISAYTNSDDGFYYNSYFGGKLGRENLSGGRLTLEYDYGQTRIVLRYVGSTETTPYENLYAAVPNDHTYSNTVDYNYHNYFHRQINAPTLEIDHDFGVASLTSASSYYVVSHDVGVDADFTNVAGVTLQQYRTTQNYSEEIRLQSQSAGRVQWLVGGFAADRSFWDREVVDLENGLNTGSSTDTSLIGQNITDTLTVNRQYAVFGNVSYDIGSWKLDAGVRGEHDTSSIEAIHGYGTGYLSIGTKQVMPKGTITYQINQTALAYATISKGFQPAGALLDIGATPNGLHTYAAETLTNFEIGLKTKSLNDRLILNGTIYYDKYKNRLFQTAALSPAGGVNELTTNVGPSTNSGLELQTQALLTKGLKLVGGYSYTRAIWGRTTVFDPNVNTLVNIDGMRAPDAPQYRGNLGVDWTQSLGDGLMFGAHIEGTYTGSETWDIVPHYRQEPYGLLNLGFRVAGDHWEIDGNVRNALDRGYNNLFISAAEFGTPFGIASLGQPRLCTISMKFTF